MSSTTSSHTPILNCLVFDYFEGVRAVADMSLLVAVGLLGLSGVLLAVFERCFLARHGPRGRDNKFVRAQSTFCSTASAFRCAAIFYFRPYGAFKFRQHAFLVIPSLSPPPPSTLNESNSGFIIPRQHIMAWVLQVTVGHERSMS